MENRIIGSTMRKLALIAGAATVATFGAPPPLAKPAAGKPVKAQRGYRRGKTVGSAPAGRTSWRQLKRAFAAGFVPPQPGAQARARHGLKP